MNATLIDTQTIIGLDTSRVPVRMVVTTLDEGTETTAPLPTDEETFHSLSDFSAHWTRCWRDSPVRVAIPAEESDPMGVRAWLEVVHPVEYYPWMAYRAHLTKDLELRDLGLTSDYERAYVLALYAAYRLRSPSVARDLWAKLFEAHYLLEDIRHEAQRLAAALPDVVAHCRLDVPF